MFCIALVRPEMDRSAYMGRRELLDLKLTGRSFYF